MPRFIRIILYLINPITFAYALPVLLLIILISPLILIRWYGITSHRIGHLIEDTTLYFCKKQAGYNVPKQHYIDIFYEKKLTANTFLSNKISKKLIIIPKIFIQPIDILQKHLSKIFPKLKKFEAYRKKNKKDGYQFINNIKFNKINFSKDESKIGNNFLEELNIDSNKLVCLNLFDGQYLKQNFPKDNFSHHNMRIDNISDYIIGIKHLISLGYYVIRMGKHNNIKCNINRKQFIDYSFLKNKNDFLDVYLISKCKFYISNATGLDHVAIHFQKPMIKIHPTIEPFEIENNNIILLCKHHINKKNKKKMTMREILEKKCFFYGKKQSWFESNNILINNNSANEIKNIFNEMHLLINNELNLDSEDIKLQKIFWDKYCNKDYYKNFNLNVEQSNILNYYNKNNIRSIFSINFLKKNKSWLIN